MCRTGNTIFCTPHVGDTCDRTNTPLTSTLRRECVNIPTVTPEHTQFIDRSKNNKICNTDVVSNIEISDKKNNEVVKLLDPLLENNVVEDVETQEIWE